MEQFRVTSDLQSLAPTSCSDETFCAQKNWVTGHCNDQAVCLVQTAPTTSLVKERQRSRILYTRTDYWAERCDQESERQVLAMVKEETVVLFPHIMQQRVWHVPPASWLTWATASLTRSARMPKHVQEASKSSSTHFAWTCAISRDSTADYREDNTKLPAKWRRVPRHPGGGRHAEESRCASTRRLVPGDTRGRRKQGALQKRKWKTETAAGKEREKQGREGGRDGLNPYGMAGRVGWERYIKGVGASAEAYLSRPFG